MIFIFFYYAIIVCFSFCQSTLEDFCVISLSMEKYWWCLSVCEASGASPLLQFVSKFSVDLFLVSGSPTTGGIFFFSVNYSLPY